MQAAGFPLQSQSGRGGAGRGPGGPSNFGAVAPSFTSLLEFYLQSKMSADEFAQIATNLCTTNGVIEGLVNVNTASAEVLACIPGIGTDNAPSLVAYRQNNPNNLKSIAWVAEALNAQNARQAGRYLTTESYQFTADIAAVGHYGRGYCRVRFVFDTSDGTPKIRYRRDLTGLGWALGNTTRQRLLLAKDIR
jgi:type II secretory pathway component PulK